MLTLSSYQNQVFPLKMSFRHININIRAKNMYNSANYAGQYLPLFVPAVFTLTYYPYLLTYEIQTPDYYEPLP